MSNIRVMRGPAPLPPDVEQQFIRSYGRNMSPEERQFFGLPTRKNKGPAKVLAFKKRGRRAA